MVTKKTLIIDLDKTWPQANVVFEKLGMGYTGTMIAFFNTIEESANFYGVDPDKVVIEINQLIN